MLEPAAHSSVKNLHPRCLSFCLSINVSLSLSSASCNEEEGDANSGGVSDSQVSNEAQSEGGRPCDPGGGRVTNH